MNRLRTRKSDFAVNEWILDSGAFTEISTYGYYRNSVQEYADCIKRWKSCGQLVAAVAQDMMCEPAVLERTGLTVADHQRLTIERYDELLRCDTGVFIMPVLQGYLPEEYVAHLRQYGDRLTYGMWVGVGSVCKRNSKPEQIEAIVTAIKRERPDLRLHLFGVKLTALKNAVVRELAWSSDSLAWSYAARRQGRNQNDWKEARAFKERVDQLLLLKAKSSEVE